MEDQEDLEMEQDSALEESESGENDLQESLIKQIDDLKKERDRLSMQLNVLRTVFEEQKTTLTQNRKNMQANVKKGRAELATNFFSILKSNSLEDELVEEILKQVDFSFISPEPGSIYDNTQQEIEYYEATEDDSDHLRVIECTARGFLFEGEIVKLAQVGIKIKT